MKKFIKNNIIGFILGAVIFSTATAFAYNLFAPDVGFTPIDDTWKKNDGSSIDNVKDALDDLYHKANGINFDNLVTEEIYTNHTSGATYTYTITNVSEYKYFFLINITWRSGSSDYTSSLNGLKINSITNATYMEFAHIGAQWKSRESAAAKTYLIYPDRSGQNITINLSNGDGFTLYGLKTKE